MSLLLATVAMGAGAAPLYSGATTRPELTQVAESQPSTDSFLASLMDTNLYSMGAYFCDRHPELVDEVLEESLEIEARGLERSAEESSRALEECFQTLVTGLAVRDFKAVAG
jgi:hypothetical protein